MTRPRFIVVGAGIVGASITWHLAERGAAVTVCDAGPGGGLATAHSFAWINASWGNPEPYFRLRVRSMAEWDRLAAAVPDLPFAKVGGLCWDMPEADFDRFLREHGAWDYGLREVGRAEAQRLEPNVLDLPERAVHVVAEAAAEPREAAQALLADAVRRGATLRFDQPVTSLIQRGDRVIGVDTGAGPVEADGAVVAAGVGSAKLLASIGRHLPITAPPGLLVHTRPHTRLLNGVVLSPKLHMRQAQSGQILCGSDFGGTDPGSDPESAAEVLFARLQGALKGGAGLTLDRFTVGHRPLPEGGLPMVGPIEGVTGLSIAVMHSGITLAPAVGLFMAAELLDDRRDPLLASFAPRVTAEPAAA